MCPLGLVWCGAGPGCQPTCEAGRQCPPVAQVDSGGRSSCQVAAHCPGNASCCLDSELYRRCVPWDSAASNTTDTAAAAPDLAAVCAAAPADLADLAGWDCR